jgi:hypothetical protein
MKKGFIAFSTILGLIGVIGILMAELLIDPTKFYPEYKITINIGAAFLTIGVVSLVSKYLTMSELTKQFSFIHDREKTGIERTFDNWEDCISALMFYKKLEKASNVTFVGYSHAKTLLVLDDDKLKKLMGKTKNFSIFLADGDLYTEGGSAINSYLSRELMVNRFPVDSSRESINRLVRLRDDLPEKKRKNVHILKYHPETINVLSIKIIDDLSLLRLIGHQQAGFNSPFIQYNQSGSLWKFTTNYISHLLHVSQEL